MTEYRFALLRHDGQVFPFGDEGVSFGRSQTNQIVISDLSVSRLHARILLSGGQCWLRDEQSAGGIYVNNLHVQGQQVVRINDVITIGSAAFRLIPAQAAHRGEGASISESLGVKTINNKVSGLPYSC